MRVDLSKQANEGYDVLPPNRPRAIALGYFDGIHRGHQELVYKLTERAVELGIEADVFSFDRFPKPVPPNARLNAMVPGQPSPESMILQSPLPSSKEPFKGLLQTQGQRDVTFARMGVDNLILQAFNTTFAGLSAEDFCDKILLERLCVKVLVVGQDYKFARRQEGDAAFLRAWAEKHGVELHVIPHVLLDGEVISSSRIRGLIGEGRMVHAAALLGHPFTIPGTVIRGNALGRTVGMPTANIRIPFGMVVPKYGVYVTRTKVGETYYDSVTNVGLRPTVNHTDPLPLVETCILDRRMDLYDQEIEVEFLKLMREEERFPSFIAMSAKIAEDLNDAKLYHRAAESLYRYTKVQDIPIYLLRSSRFNTAYLQVEFFVPLKEETVSDYSLLSQVLSAVAPDYPTRPEFRSFLDEQYGALVEAWVSRVNNLQKISFRLSAVQNGVDGSNPFMNCVDTFLSMLLRPVRDEEDHFPANIIETERQNLLMEYLAGCNDKSQYACDRAEAQLLRDPDEWLNPLGTEEGLKRADKVSLRDAWVRMLSEGAIRAFMYGRFDDCSLADEIAHQLASVPRRENALTLMPARNPLLSAFPRTREIQEFDDVELAHLVMVFTGLPVYSSLEILQARVLNYMFGEAQQSLLFREIREKLGYAYYVDSTYDIFAQTMTVTAEVDPEKTADTCRVVLEQLEALAEGSYPEELFRSAVKLYQKDLLQIRDDLDDSLAFDSNGALAGTGFSTEEVMHFTDGIKEESVRALAGSLKRQLTYVLLPRDAEPVWGVEGETDS